jgi:hypothetical protein
MSKTQAFIAAFAVVLALAGLTASVSSAAGSWYVEGAKLAAGSKESLATTAAVETAAVLNDPAESLKVTCTGGTGKTLDGVAPFIEGTEKGGAEALTFLGCSEVTPANCSVETTFSTNPIITTLATATSPEDRVTVTPKTGKELVELNINGATCAITGGKPITGSFTLAAPTGEVESALQPIEGLGSVENNSLLIAGHHSFWGSLRAKLHLRKFQIGISGFFSFRKK